VYQREASRQLAACLSPDAPQGESVGSSRVAAEVVALRRAAVEPAAWATPWAVLSVQPLGLPSAIPWEPPSEAPAAEVVVVVQPSAAPAAEVVAAEVQPSAALAAEVVAEVQPSAALAAGVEVEAQPSAAEAAAAAHPSAAAVRPSAPASPSLPFPSRFVAPPPSVRTAHAI